MPKPARHLQQQLLHTESANLSYANSSTMAAVPSWQRPPGGSSCPPHSWHQTSVSQAHCWPSPLADLVLAQQVTAREL